MPSSKSTFVRRPPNPWDRFYRFHEAPWRGERPIADLKPFLGDGRVLELGCGNGKALRPLEAAGFDVVGLEVSWHALRRLGRGALADASVLPFADGSFSAVLDLHCCGHLGKEARAAAAVEQFRVLQPGGHVVVERLGSEDLRASQGRPVDGEPGMRGLEDGRRTHFLDEAGLRQHLVAVGFEVVDAETVRRTPRLRGTRVVRESVRVIGRRP